MRSYLFLLIMLFALAGCNSGAGAPTEEASNPPRPSQITANEVDGASMAPQDDFFYSLPSYSVGETASQDGYTAEVTDVALDGGLLQITLDLANDSGHPIDLGWAVQLIQEGTGTIIPTSSPINQTNDGGQQLLADDDELGGTWSYTLAEGVSPNSQIDLDDYRLLYAPFGWSGPVFIFRLTDIAR